MWWVISNLPMCQCDLLRKHFFFLEHRSRTEPHLYSVFFFFCIFFSLRIVNTNTYCNLIKMPKFLKIIDLFLIFFCLNVGEILSTSFVWCKKKEWTFTTFIKTQFLFFFCCVVWEHVNPLLPCSPFLLVTNWDLQCDANSLFLLVLNDEICYLGHTTNTRFKSSV